MLSWCPLVCTRASGKWIGEERSTLICGLSERAWWTAGRGFTKKLGGVKREGDLEYIALSNWTRDAVGYLDTGDAFAGVEPFERGCATYPLPKKEGSCCDVSVIYLLLFWMSHIKSFTPTFVLHFDIHLSLSLFIMIPRSARHPTRRQSRNLLGSMSLVLFTVLALILLCPVAVNAADEDKKSEYGTVIGIGE